MERDQSRFYIITIIIIYEDKCGLSLSQSLIFSLILLLPGREVGEKSIRHDLT